MSAPFPNVATETAPGGPKVTVPKVPGAGIPTFRQPVVRPLDPPLPEDENQEPAPASPDPASRRRGVAGGLLGTLTDTSSPVSKPSLAVTTQVIVGLLGLGLGVAAWALKRRGKLRQPTDDEFDDIGRPLARLALRFVPAHLLNATLVDVLEAGTATGAYINNGPLIVPGGNIDPGVPAGLDDDPERESNG